MKTIKDFTPEIQAKIPEYIERYTKGVFDGGRYSSFNHTDAEALIDWNYETAGYKKPVVLVAENPLESQVLFNYIKANEKVFTPILYAIYCSRNGIDLPKEMVPVENKELDSQLDSQLRSQLDSQLDSQLRSQLRSQLGSQLRSQLGSQLRSQLGEYHYDYLFTANVYSNSWLAWYGFMANELKIDAPINVMLSSWNNLYEKSGVYSAVFSELVCVVSKYPKKVHRNSNNDMHNVDGPAVEWGSSTDITNFDCYYVDGMNIEKDLFHKLSKQEISFEDFVKEQNEEVKSSILAFYRAKFGDEFMFRFLSKNLKEVDTYVDNKAEEYLVGTTGGMNIGVYTLFSGRLMDEDIAYVRVFCPSTDRMFFLGVEPKHNNAKDAIASLYRVPRKLRQHIKHINRQGEVYSTNFTDEGLKLLKSMSKQDVSDLVGITGNEYFSNLKYEY